MIRPQGRASRGGGPRGGGGKLPKIKLTKNDLDIAVLTELNRERLRDALRRRWPQPEPKSDPGPLVTQRAEPLRVMSTNVAMFPPVIMEVRDSGTFDLVLDLAVAVAAVLVGGAAGGPVGAAAGIAFALAWLESGRSNTDRAEQIATQILESGVDIVALQEVWDDDAREVFVKALSHEYPHLVLRSSVPFETAANDLGVSTWLLNSGLMLFSRFPFEDFPLSGTGSFEAVSNGSNSQKAAFRVFDDASGIDWFAAKGVGCVSVRPAGFAAPIGVLFTHLQNEDQQVAVAQLLDVHDLASDIAGAGGPELFVLLGDLNIKGPTDGSAGDSDYQTLLGPAGLFRDTWVQGPPDYPCRTNAVDRIDHCAVLDLRPPERADGDRLVGAHHMSARMLEADGAQPLRTGMSRPGHPARAQGPWLSDHLGVAVILQHEAAHATPATAAVLDFAADDEATTVLHLGESTGQYRWARVNDAGSFRVLTGPPGVEVFASREMCIPAWTRDPLEEGGRDDTRYVFDQPPYFIRVGDGETAGSTTLRVVMDVGQSRDSAIAIGSGLLHHPAPPHERPLSFRSKVAYPDGLWLELNPPVLTEPAGNAARQTVRLSWTAGHFSATLHDADGGMLDTFHDGAGSCHVEFDSDGQRGPLYVRIQRTDPSHGELTCLWSCPVTSIGHDNDYGGLHFGLLCKNETGWDKMGDDEVAADVAFDGGSSRVTLGDMNSSGPSSTIEPFQLEATFAREHAFRLVELEGAGDDTLGPWRTQAPIADHELIRPVDDHYELGTGVYSLTYNVARARLGGQHPPV